MSTPAPQVDYVHAYRVIVEVRPDFAREVTLEQWILFNQLRDEGLATEDIADQSGITVSKLEFADRVRNCVIKCHRDFRPHPNFDTCLRRCVKG